MPVHLLLARAHRVAADTKWRDTSVLCPASVIFIFTHDQAVLFVLRWWKDLANTQGWIVEGWMLQRRHKELLLPLESRNSNMEDIRLMWTLKKVHALSLSNFVLIEVREVHTYF